MIVSELSQKSLRECLNSEGLVISTGPFNCRIFTNVNEVVSEISALYGQHCIPSKPEFIDFHINIVSQGLRRWFRPQARFIVDEVEPFRPLPRSHALPMLEWGLNWCITAYSHHLLVLHAASVAKDNQALILPAPPGSGKSTLCAALVNRGWRLLSDELTIIRLDTGEIHGLARPVNLKNASIDVVREFAPDAYLSASVYDTTKGTVALMAPPAGSVRLVDQMASPRWMVLPRYIEGSSTIISSMPTGEAFMQIADNAMNYHVLGVKGFEAVSGLVDRCEHYRLVYSQLEDVIRQLDWLASKG